MTGRLTHVIRQVAAELRTIVFDRPSTLALVWSIATCLAASDILAAGVVPGPPRLYLVLALALAAAGLTFSALALARGLAALHVLATARRRAALAEDAVRREAESGIAQIEAFLARNGKLRDH